MCEWKPGSGARAVQLTTLVPSGVQLHESEDRDSEVRGLRSRSHALAWIWLASLGLLLGTSLLYKTREQEGIIRGPSWKVADSV